jgi:hypothetical protein
VETVRTPDPVQPRRRGGTACLQAAGPVGCRLHPSVQQQNDGGDHLDHKEPVAAPSDQLQLRLPRPDAQPLASRRPAAHLG